LGGKAKKAKGVGGKLIVSVQRPGSKNILRKCQ